jgi:hypothetical protein
VKLESIPFVATVPKHLIGSHSVTSNYLRNANFTTSAPPTTQHQSSWRPFSSLELTAHQLEIQERSTVQHKRSNCTCPPFKRCVAQKHISPERDGTARGNTEAAHVHLAVPTIWTAPLTAPSTAVIRNAQACLNDCQEIRVHHCSGVRLASLTLSQAMLHVHHRSRTKYLSMATRRFACLAWTN